MQKRILTLSMLLVVLALAAAASATTPKKVRIGYFGTTCEAPLFAAIEKGFFQAEGLQIEATKGDATSLREALALNKIDATDGLLMQWVKPIEQGLNVKFTAGVHTGCVQILAGSNSGISSIQGLAGKRIGVPAIGSGPHNLAARVLATNGIDAKSGVEWRAFPMAELELALDKGEVDAIALADPIAQIVVDKGKASTLLNSAKTAPYNEEYCCLVVVNGKLIKEDPATAAAITRAILKAARWVSEHPQEAAALSVEKKYVGGNPELNAKILSGYKYIPSVKGGRDAIAIAAGQMQKAGILSPSTDIQLLAKNSFVELPGLE